MKDVGSEFYGKDLIGTEWGEKYLRTHGGWNVMMFRQMMMTPLRTLDAMFLEERRRVINSAVAEVEEQYKAGLLPWTYKTVQSLITPYPRRGQLDEIKVGQADEATPDPDRVPWEDEKGDEERARRHRRRRHRPATRADDEGADDVAQGGGDARADAKAASVVVILWR